MSDIVQVSVIVPVFNNERTINRALDSVFAQTHSNFEIIVVDDCSSDQTVDIVAQYGSDRLTVIRHKQNRGAAAARNTGIEAARGRWVAFLDADDAWFREKLGRQVDLLERDGGESTGCLTGYLLHKGSRERSVSLNMAPKAFQSNVLFGCTFSPGTTLMVDRNIFKEIGPFDENFRRLEDWEWLLRFSKRYDMRFLPEPLAHVYVELQTAIDSARKNDLTLDAIRLMNLKHGSGQASWLRQMRLKSSLLIELAAAMQRKGRPLAAVLYVCAALIVYPFRNLAFFRMLVRSVAEQVRLR